MSTRNKSDLAEGSSSSCRPDNNWSHLDWLTLRTLLIRMRSASSEACTQALILENFPNFSAEWGGINGHSTTTEKTPLSDSEHALLIVQDQYDAIWPKTTHEQPTPEKQTPAIPESDGHRKLTERELQVSNLVVEAYTNAMIARDLGISKRTVEKHVENIFRKLRFADRRELIIAARNNISEKPQRPPENGSIS